MTVWLRKFARYDLPHQYGIPRNLCGAELSAALQGREIAGFSASLMEIACAD